MATKYYDVYSKGIHKPYFTNMVLTATASSLARRFGVSSAVIRDIGSIPGGGLIEGPSGNMFKITESEYGTFDYTYKPHPKNVKYVPKKEPAKYEDIYGIDCIRGHLLDYGNTIMVEDPKKMVRKLKKEGFDISVRYWPANSTKSSETELNHESLTEADWVLTCNNLNDMRQKFKWSEPSLA